MARHLKAIRNEDAHHKTLRAASRTGQPLGRNTFLNKLEAHPGHRLLRYGRGRPKGSKYTRTRKSPPYRANVEKLAFMSGIVQRTLLIEYMRRLGLRGKE